MSQPAARQIATGLSGNFDVFEPQIAIEVGVRLDSGFICDMTSITESNPFRSPYVLETTVRDEAKKNKKYGHVITIGYLGKKEL